MTSAQVLSIGGLLAAGLGTAGWLRTASGVMLIANLAAFGLDWWRSRHAR